MQVYVHRPDRFAFDWKAKGAFNSHLRINVFVPDGTYAVTEFEDGQLIYHHIHLGGWWSRFKYELGLSQKRPTHIVVYGDNNQRVLLLRDIGWEETAEIIVYLTANLEDGLVVGYRGQFHEMNDRLVINRWSGPPPDDAMAIPPRAV